MSSLKDVLERNGKATNHNSAWGYSAEPLAELLPDGKINVLVYLMEGEFSESVYNSPEEVDYALYVETSAVSTSYGGKKFEAKLALQETGFTVVYEIDGQAVSYEEYSRAFPEEYKKDEAGGWLPVFWNGPGEWE